MFSTSTRFTGDLFTRLRYAAAATFSVGVPITVVPTIVTNGESQQVPLGGRVEVKKVAIRRKNPNNGNFTTWLAWCQTAEKAEGPEGQTQQMRERRERGRKPGPKRASEPPQRAQRPRGSVSLAQSSPRVNQILPALRLARASLGLPGAHLPLAWGLLPQSTRAPPCGATAPAWKTDLRPGKHTLSNGSGPMHLLATMGIGQRTPHPLFYVSLRNWSPSMPIRH